MIIIRLLGHHIGLGTAVAFRPHLPRSNIDNDTGYPHDGRADKDSYPHGGRVDKVSYPHDGLPIRILIRTAGITNTLC